MRIVTIQYKVKDPDGKTTPMRSTLIIDFSYHVDDYLKTVQDYDETSGYEIKEELDNVACPITLLTTSYWTE